MKKLFPIVLAMVFGFGSILGMADMASAQQWSDEMRGEKEPAASSLPRSSSRGTRRRSRSGGGYPPQGPVAGFTFYWRDFLIRYSGMSTSPAVYFPVLAVENKLMAMVACKVCKKSFKAKPFWLKKGFGKYCSPACQYAGMRKGEEKPCFICGEATYKKQKQLRGSKSGLFFCSKSCQTRWRNQLYIGAKHANFTTGMHSYRSVLERHKVPKVCRLCNMTDARALAVHHIDKNRKNNTLKNLAWLCHNCHFLVHHYESERVKLR